MRKTDPGRLRNGIEKMTRAMREHAAWQERLLRRIVAGEPLPGGDLVSDSHPRCQFDYWYFERSHPVLWGNPAFAALGLEHHRLHRISDELLGRIASDEFVAVEDFDALLDGPDRLRALLAELESGIDAANRSRDPASGACSRELMRSELGAWNELASGGLHCCLVSVDVDDLEGLRAACGPQAVHRVLASAMKFVRRHVRPYDRLYGHPGEPYLLAMPGTDLSVAKAIIRRVRERLARRQAVAGATGSDVAVTASFGLAMLDPAAGVEESIARADQALLVAKAAGRNLAMSWDPSVTTGTRLPRLRLEDVGQ